MNRLFILLLLCIAAATASFAQHKADVIVSYNYDSPTLQGKIQTDRMTLLASQTRAKFFNTLSEWVDSLKSTDAGKAQYNEIIRKSCIVMNPDGSMSVDMTKGPTKKVYTYIYSNLDDESLTLYDKFGDDLGVYTEPLSEMSWDIIPDSTSNILGYDCLMARSTYHGRTWKAWFTPDLPLGFGPWKLRGLPGIILKATADGGFAFTATGIERTDREITPVYSKDSYDKVIRKKALLDNENYRNNIANILSSKHGSRVTVNMKNDAGEIVDAPRYEALKHSLEPDYKTNSNDTHE